MVNKEELVERLMELGRNFERHFRNEEWKEADIQYQRFCVITDALEMTEQDLKPVYDAHMFQMYKTDHVLSKLNLWAISNNPYGIREKSKRR